jgi:iron complex transport system ATP-binding protein
MSFSTTDYGVTLRGKPILKGLNVHVAAGHTLALLGANGAGKSTFMKGLCGLVPAFGFASINGTALLGMSPATRARMIGYVAQDLAHLDVRLSTYELRQPSCLSYLDCNVSPKNSLGNFPVANDR